MVGVLVDQKIFSEMINRFDKELARKFSKLGIDPSLFSLQWFICCYVSTLSPKVSIILFFHETLTTKAC